MIDYDKTVYWHFHFHFSRFPSTHTCRRKSTGVEVSKNCLVITNDHQSDSPAAEHPSWYGVVYHDSASSVGAG